MMEWWVVGSDAVSRDGVGCLSTDRGLFRTVIDETAIIHENPMDMLTQIGKGIL